MGGLSEDKDYETMKQYREAELQHGRVAMLGALGMLITEEPIEFHPLFEADNKDIGPAIRHLDEVRAVSPAFFEILALIIGALEFNRAITGWNAPGDVFGSGRIFKEEYFTVTLVSTLLDSPPKTRPNSTSSTPRNSKTTS